MQKKPLSLVTVLLLLIWALSSSGQDCTGQWQFDLETGYEGPKPYMGDTNAAYGIFKFKTNPKVFYRMKGKFPRARFFSVESYRTTKNKGFDSRFDHQIEPDAGSENPFRDGVEIETDDRSYTIDFFPESKARVSSNVMKLPEKDKVGSVWVRYYQPHDGESFSPTHLPQIEAFDVETGAPAACPQIVDEIRYANYPDFLTVIMPKKRKPFAFKQFSVDWAGNSGVGGYSYGASKMKLDEVMVIRVKVPSHVQTDQGSGPFSSKAQLRYFSICSIHFVKNKGLFCLPDSALTPDENGFVTVVHGQDSRLAEAAESRGFHYLPDLRDPKTRMVMIAYRNILPSAEFKAFQYQGDYNPTAVICSAQEFLQDNCR